MAALAFRAVMRIDNINPYVHVSAARARTLKPGWRKPLPVLVRINGKPEAAWRINMMPMGDGGFYLYLHAGVRKAAGAQVGNRVNVEVTFDESYRSGPAHPMPAWLRASLAENGAAEKAFAALIPSRKKELLRYLAGLKSPQAQARNLAKAMHVLSGHAGRFMARDWAEGK